MAYTELIKNFERIRSYMREFYVYGLKRRTEYDAKSARSYDNERRRIESWLGDYISFRQSASGKNMFLAIDSRSARRNPLYKAWKAKSFTDADITLHFMIFDILHAPDIAVTLSDMAEAMDCNYLSFFQTPMAFDESTLRKKLQEYAALGLIQTEKHGRTIFYRRSPNFDLSDWGEALSFFSEADMAGVIGSFLLDREGWDNDHYTFKHHYITHALESDILCALFDAMSQKRSVSIKNYNRRAGDEKEWNVVPLRIFASVQSGRRYLMAWNLRFKKTTSYRLDYITAVKLGEVFPDFDRMRVRLAENQKHMWGVLCDDRQSPALEHVAFTVNILDGEEHIWRRLEREKRCGRITKMDEHTARFEADVYDTSEMIPWIRTFTGRITAVEFSNKAVEALFRKDFEVMCRLYGAGGETVDLP